MRIAVHGKFHPEPPKAEMERDDRLVLCWEGEYRRGDYIDFEGLTPNTFYVIHADACLDASIIFVTSESIRYTVPFYEKKENYNPLAFSGCRHVIELRKAEDWELTGRRNLAFNPFDQQEVDTVFPHASANTQTRGESQFAPRNAIDGLTCTRSHGNWPYESWGINRQADAKFRLDFGRPVDIDEIRLYTRAQFPHDSWWTEGTLSFSDGSQITFPMEKKIDDPHVIKAEKKGITWLTLGNLIKAPDESPFPALKQIEVYGTEHRD